MTLPDGFRLTRVDRRYELSWVNWRVQRTRFPFWLVLAFVPFLVIDLVVAAILMAMGMMMLSPIIISLPFKLMLFVLIDGWSLVTSTLVRSFAG